MLKYVLTVILFFIVIAGIAHPMPASVVNLSVMDGLIKGEAVLQGVLYTPYKYNTPINL